MSVKRRIFAGSQLRNLRAARNLRQAEMADRLDISVSYLSQLENDDRPLSNALLERLAREFPLDWQDVGADSTEKRLVALREATADPLFAEPLPAEQLARIAEQQPGFAERFIALHEAYRRTGQRLEMVDEALAADNASGTRLPWEEVRDWFHFANNYVDTIDRAAEALSIGLIGDHGLSPLSEALEQQLAIGFSVSVRYESNRGLREFDPQMGHLVIDPAQPAETRRFQLAHQLAALALKAEIASVIAAATLRSPAGRQLLFVGLCNYAASAILMPYRTFREEARRLRHDIDRLAHAFGTSFEQTCQRLSTLQRADARGVPFYFCKVDMAGNITKRHSATRLQFARFGGACPLWIVHEAVAIPDRILVQLAETPDGVRYVSMAKGLVKPSGSFERSPRRYALALGCEAAHADEFVYADGLDLASPHRMEKIGVSCRLCPRPDCDQRAFPPSDRAILVDPDQRGIVPYRIN
ncbi:putative Xre family transcriptional regulator [Caenibius tardaugens NBRC 16725]|uniref:Putative Xre family transcriptional regulator n=1 Tax=Caenibius tardaugens NBRC 16725 TaxID=1219035 RepID=U2Y5L2_9SPHN|nr:helix-turn-helix transcriptional regulator [Caenibius tardaugens]AZI34878.1 XRE family transcriptional regulator [Caenibius tardaugens NBRC 16725]GAD48411.1 putative Xre family transcriptional regulator [Caenibius tardaugens NBRC 16725]